MIIRLDLQSHPDQVNCLTIDAKISAINENLFMKAQNTMQCSSCSIEAHESLFQHSNRSLLQTFSRVCSVCELAIWLLKGPARPPKF